MSGANKTNSVLEIGFFLSGWRTSLVSLLDLSLQSKHVKTIEIKHGS